ncbi:histidine kinase N-terminal 7TM domain-containing protein [Methanobacterium sp. ACI-7]|uniref:histidine kinase N-terminal 7TM domain-containing protein n=1 Tax=unclassified Methanobacterium TaxID=2627676 RepID=UPI0039C057DE
MGFQYSPYSLELIIASLIPFFLALYALKKRSIKMHSYFILLMFSVGIWALCIFLEFSSTDINSKILFAKLSYIGVATVAPLWLLFSLSYAKYEKFLKKRYISLLMVIPAIVLFLVFTNEWHGLIWPEIIISSDLPGNIPVYGHNIGVWVNMVYAYFLILLGIVLLFQTFINSPRKYKFQTSILILGAFVPLTSNIFYAANLFTVNGLDLTPFIFVVSGILIALTIFRFQLLDNVPIAYHELFRNMNNSFFIFDFEDNLLEFNPEAQKIFRLSSEDIGKRAEDIFSNWEEILSFYKESPDCVDEVFIEDPVNCWIKMQINSLYDSQNTKTGKLLIIHNIDAQKKVEEALRESENRYKILTHVSPDAVIVFIDKKIVFANEATAELLGAKDTDEIIGRSLEEIIHPDYIEIAKKQYNLAENDRKYSDYTEEKIIRKDGTTIYIEAGTVPTIFNNKKAVQSVVRDITPRKNLEKELKKSLDEKDIMMKEIHHRVKNNLIVISSLLNMQSRYIKDKEALDIFTESKNRAKSMALIHEKLYQSNDLKRINFGNYLRTLAQEIFQTYRGNSDNTTLNTNVDDIMLDINTSIPLGLIVNELISNCFKHAFKSNEKGQIWVNFHQKGEEFKVIIRDDGDGFPEDIDITNAKSMGLMLVNSLVKQIDGTIEIDCSEGTRIEIKFTEKQY